MVTIAYGKRSLLLLLISVLTMLAGCASADGKARQDVFKPQHENPVVYVFPFAATLVPAEVQKTAFNDFVDLLNEDRARAGVSLFEIIKDSPADIDKEWLSRQAYLSGELWSYIENAGCCQTELRVRSRMALTEPGRQAPSFEVVLPLDSFFDHDQSTLEIERVRLAKELARKLADKVISSLASRK